MHRAIINAPEDKLVDHINRDRLDNRRENLRLVNARENSRNSKPRNILGLKGVTKRAASTNRPYRSFLYIEGRTYVTEAHSTAYGAAFAYDKLAKEHFGEYAYLNFPCVFANRAALKRARALL